ncbi:LptF/LptG family permease [Candidatus Finniella inopinata]|uniref:LptF/LptG family permease n=1 Tax=Candidatus Finniella inopinata TaxID=1696036 RepID=A0A4Q7DNI8_9PROT|nr:LptF/LptG family permease [Candidatus Finniella inopinata]RZI46446.1 LptF/LptG family permease [Candidatus Finniella inopinata]
MNILFRYIFKKLFNVTIGLSFILIGIVWLTQSLRFIEIIVNHNISLKTYLSLIICLIPDLLSTILPICLLISGLYTYHKLKSDHELHVFYAIGLSPSQVARPLLLLAFLLMTSVFVINIFVAPLSFQHFRRQEFQIRNQFSLSWIREGTFNQVKGITTYVREHTRNGELKGVFIYNPQNQKTTLQSNKGVPYTIIAESGAVEKNKDGLFLILKKGIRQELNPVTQKIALFSFDTLKYHVPTDQDANAVRLAKPYEKPLAELFNPPENTDPRSVAKMRVEGHQRLLLPWITIMNAFIAGAFTLLGSFNRRKGRYKIFLAATVSLLIHTTVVTLLNLSVDHLYTIKLAYGAIALSIIVFMVILKVNFSGLLRGRNK